MLLFYALPSLHMPEPLRWYRRHRERGGSPIHRCSTRLRYGFVRFGLSCIGYTYFGVDLNPLITAALYTNRLHARYSRYCSYSLPSSESSPNRVCSPSAVRKSILNYYQGITPCVYRTVVFRYSSNTHPIFDT